MKPELQAFLLSLRDVPSFNRPVYSVHERGASSQTPLHVAAIRGDLLMVEALLDEGADINATGEHGYTPLMEAIEQGHAEVIGLLKNRGATGREGVRA